MDQLIRELLVDIKQKGANAATKSVKQLGTALEDAANNVGNLNERLSKLPSSLSAIERSAKKTSEALSNIKVNTSVIKSIDDITARVDKLSASATQLDVKLTTAFNSAAKSATKMSADIGAATDKASADLTALGAKALKVTTDLGNLKVNVSGLKSVDEISSKLERLSSTVHSADKTMTAGFNSAGAASVRMTGDIIASTAKAESQLTGLSSAAVAVGTSLSNIKVSSTAAKSLDKVATSMDKLASTASKVDVNIAAGFGAVGSAATKMSSDIISASNSASAQLSALSTAATKVKNSLASIKVDGNGLKPLTTMVTRLNELSTAVTNMDTVVGAGISAAGIAASKLATSISQAVASSITELSMLAAESTKVGASLGSIRISSSMVKSLDMIVDKLDELISAVVEMDSRMGKGFNHTAEAAVKMANEISAATEKTTDQLISLNTASGKASGGLRNVSDAAGRANRAIANTGGSSRGVVRQFADMAKSGGGLTMVYATLAANMFVVKTIFDQLTQGDQLNRLNQFGVVIGSLTGVPVQNMAKALQEATGYAVSFEEAMRQATVASAYGFSTEQISQFALVARRAAAVLGIDMTDALNRVIKGVSKQEIELLDELGVTIRLNDAYTAYVKTLNAANTGITYNIQNLTSFQKQQAYANAVVAESTRRFGQLDGVLRATPWELFAANADSALRQVQMAAAKYLTPLIDSMNAFFYQTKAFQSTAAAVAQQQSNAQVDPNNNTAVVSSLAGSQEGYDSALKAQKEAQDTSLELKKQYNAAYASADWALQGAINLGLNGLPNTMADSANKAWVDQMVSMGNNIKRLDQEVSDSQASVDSWKKAVDSAAQTAAKAAPGLQKTIGLTAKFSSDLPDATKSFTFNTEALKGAENVTRAFTSLKTTARDTASSISTIGTGTGEAAKAAGGLKDAIAIVKQASTVTGQNVDSLVKDLPLGYKTLAEMEKSYSAIDRYTKATTDTGKMQLAAEQARATVLKQGGKTQDASTAAAKVEAQYYAEQVSAVKELIAVQGETPALAKQLNELQAKQLQQTNSTYHDAAKVKDVTAKVVGLEEKLALLKDTSLTSEQYKTAELVMAVKIEGERLAILQKQSHVEKDIFNAKIAQAEAQRNLRLDSFDRDSSAASNAYTNAMAQVEIQGLGEQASLTQDILQTRIKIAALAEAAKKDQVVVDSQEKIAMANELASKEAQLKRLQDAQSRSQSNAVTSSLGGVGSSTFGLNSEDASTTEQANKMAYYDQSISKLSELNSAATATAQGIGNAIQQMAQFAEGSISATSMVAAGAQAISSALAMSSNNRVSAIDAEIAAEQKRDGKSAESQAKIKALEAKKTQEQRKQAQKQIAIQTAVAIMMAAANPWPFPAIPMMAAATLAGALSYSMASSGNMDTSTASDTGSQYLSLGERQKSVDVSVAANAGELSYMQGARGVGTANNFAPRAEGGDMLPGMSYLLGEHGTEVATPKVPMKVTSADEAKNAGSTGFGNTFHLNVQAMDAASFADFLDNNKFILRDSLEGALNENGTSLKSLNR
jgi:hypothetical protein